MVKLNYNNHRYFKSRHKLKVDKKLVKEFNNFYNNYQKSKVGRKELFRLLKNLFKGLNSNQNSERLNIFLSELLHFSKNILGDDLTFFDKKNNKKVESEMDKNSFFVTNISNKSLNILNKLALFNKKKFQKKAGEGFLKREDLQINSGLIIKAIVFVLNNELKKNGVLNELENYMSGKYKVSGCSLELSHHKSNWWKSDYNGKNESPKTLYYHYDETKKNPKAILYLSDVTQKNGPLKVSPLDSEISTPLMNIIGRAIQYVGKKENSVLKKEYNHIYHKTFGCKKFREDFSCLPDDFQFNSHLGWDILPNSKLEKYILNNESEIVGEAGSLVVFDGANLLHRGGMVESGQRLALQIVFSQYE